MEGGVACEKEQYRANVHFFSSLHSGVKVEAPVSILLTQIVNPSRVSPCQREQQ